MNDPPPDLGDVLRGQRVVPAVRVARADQAVPVARALVAGGVTIMEVLLRTPEALEAVRRVTSAVPEMTVGAGTVLDPASVRDAVEAGSRFIVSPGLSSPVADECARLRVPYLPGVATATEILAARAIGLRVVKLFPAGVIGLGALDALATVFDDVRFVPTGGLGAADARDWLARPSVAAVGGSWLTPSAAIEDGDWTAITARAREATRP